MRSVPAFTLPLLRPRSSRRFSAFLASAAAAVPLAATLALASPAAAAVERVETPIASSSPQSDVAASLVKIKVPLPKSAARHSEACDWLQYVRFRSTTGPADATQADSVAVLMPGIFEGAMAFDPLARNSVRAAKRRGRNIEVWAIDRRGNCLEDLTGLNKAEASGNVQDAFDYYFKGLPVDGKKFRGWNTSDRVLADIGLGQTVRDYYAVLTNELPSQPWRESHVLCGGHSLGGPLTQVFAGWDFDGDPKTTEDKGYRQCAGFVGFETYLDLDPTEDYRTLKRAINLLTFNSPHSLRTAPLPLLKAGLLPRRPPIDGLDPLSTTVFEAIGLAAAKHPDGPAKATLDGVPPYKSIEKFLHLAGSTNLLNLINNRESIRDYRYTNMALLGQLFDDNGTVISPIRASFGFFDGGKLRRNKIADQLSPIPLVNWGAQQNPLFTPFKWKEGDATTAWKNYDGVGGEGQPGHGIISPNSEVTDARDFARIQYEGPTNFTEPYLPLRLVLELTSFYGHDRGGDLANFTRHPMRKKPRMVSNGLSGVAYKAKLGTVDPHVMNEGYEHVDAITAAETQNDGRPEGSSTMLADMVDTVVPR